MQLLANIEESLLLWIQNNLRGDIQDIIMTFITRLGDSGFIWIILSMILLLIRRTRKVGLLSGVSLVIMVVVNNIILKNVFSRIRPYETIEGLNRIIEKQHDFSFPSGHTCAAFASAVVIFMLLPKKYSVWALVLAFLIGFSRIYVGVHYLTDVIAGAVLGTIIAISVVMIYNKIIRNRRKKYDKLEEEIKW